MTIFRILLTKDGQVPVEYMISGVPLILGRSTRADIALTDDSISRRHARFHVLNNTLYVEDLGSSNGVHVNGKRIQKAPLSDADIVQIGEYIIRTQRLDDAGQKKLVRRTEIEHGDVAPIHDRLVVSNQSSVAFLYRISQCLCMHRQMGPLLERVLDAVMANIPADRGIILIRSKPDTALVTGAAQTRPGRVSDTPISRTLIGHVLETRTSVLTEDAANDERFESSESIASFDIRAVICVPLTGQDGVYGVLYVDADSMPTPLTQHHLQLLSVTGQIVGSGIENILLMERQIRQERLAGIGETISGTSHDMRNIMMGINGGADMMEMACESGNWNQARSGVGIVRRSLSRFDRLVNSLLAYARETKVALEEADLAPLAAEAAAAARPESEKRGIRLLLEHQDVSRVAMDPDQIYRVLSNLIKNSMEAMPESGGTITIETGRNESSVFLRVRDTGCGIDSENMSRIGQPFFTTKGEAGTGLGLAVSYRIMEQHHGRVSVESTPGLGATFTLHFPLELSDTRHDNLSA